MRETGAPILTDVQRRAIATLESRLEHIAHPRSVIARLGSLDPDAPGAIDDAIPDAILALSAIEVFAPAGGATLLHGYDGMRTGLQIACRRQIETK